jgi:DNA-binding MarR family transcriptional regulator
MWYGAAVVRKSADRAVVDEWREVLAQYAHVWGALDRELGDNHGLGASEFEVLERLAESPDDCPGMRVQELAGAVHLSQSALSRLIGRLENDGLVTRAICVEDRRGIYVHLTEAGQDRYTAARPTHRAVLAATLSAPH